MSEEAESYPFPRPAPARIT